MLKGLVVFGLSRRPIILLGLLVFVGAGFFAFLKLNIEAYPNPAPVIIEITAQTAGQSAEEMERYYTIPMEVGLSPTPGVNIIRSTSFYGLSFVRVTFRYGIDYYFAVLQAALSLQQNVSLPNNVQPQIQASSLVGEIFRYQVVGPPHFGLTNLRTVQDWILQRRFLTVPGVVQVNTWGGTTKEYEVEIDLNKLDAYSVTIPQVIAAIGNANINVGGRTINMGQQSVNVRGVGLIDSGGSLDLTQGYKVNDIENISLAQVNGVPVQVKDVARVYVGNVPRLGKAGRDNEDDVVAAILVMNRTLHTNDVVPRIVAEVEKINRDGSLPPGVKVVPFYDRSTLVSVTTHTVLHNLIFGCILVFVIQWIFLGDLRSAIIVGVNIPFALFFSIIILVILGEDANLLSLGAVDFGIIVNSAVILVENVFRNCQGSPEARQTLLDRLAEERWGTDPTKAKPGEASNVWTERLRLILISALEVEHRRVLFGRHHGRGLRSAVHHARRRGPDFQSDGAYLWLRHGRCPDRDVHHHAGAGIVPAAGTYRGGGNDRGACVALRLFAVAELGTNPSQGLYRARRRFFGRHRDADSPSRHRISAGTRGRQSVDSRVDAADHLA